MISGRLLRSLQRLRNKTLRKFQGAISRTKKGSKRRRKLLDAKYRFLNNIELRIEHAMHTISAQAMQNIGHRNVKKIYFGHGEPICQGVQSLLMASLANIRGANRRF